MIVEKDVARVSVGSFVVSIVKQQGSHKIKHKGWVKDLRTIERLIELGVERVTIDTSKVLNTDEGDTYDSDVGDLPEQTLDREEQETSEKSDSEDKTEKKVSPNVKSNPLTDKISPKNLRKAKALFSEAKNIQKKILDDVVKGQQISLQEVKSITEQSTLEIFENPDALACIINIREKDDYLLEHSTSVSILISIFARYLGIDIEITKELSVGAFLHDIGKIMIPSHILDKPGKLTDDEFVIMKTHIDHSIKLISAMPAISELSLSVAALHHEKIDGSGYPSGLLEKDISKYGKMITICDIYDALTAHRVYKEGMAQVKAFSILLNMAKRNLLDIHLVNSFIKCMGVYPVGSLVQLNSKQLAVVEESNPNDPTRPRVKTFYSVSQMHFVGSKEINLANNEREHIEKGVRADDFDLDMNKILEFLIMDG